MCPCEIYLRTDSSMHCKCISNCILASYLVAKSYAVHAVMVCMQACPHDSVELRLRPPGIDLWTSHKPMAAELALQFTLLGAGMLQQ